jgi:hypothetical protein
MCPKIRMRKVTSLEAATFDLQATTQARYDVSIYERNHLLSQLYNPRWVSASSTISFHCSFLRTSVFKLSSFMIWRFCRTFSFHFFLGHPFSLDNGFQRVIFFVVLSLCILSKCTKHASLWTFIHLTIFLFFKRVFISSFVLLLRPFGSTVGP